MWVLRIQPWSLASKTWPCTISLALGEGDHCANNFSLGGQKSLEHTQEIKSGGCEGWGGVREGGERMTPGSDPIRGNWVDDFVIR